MSQQITLEELKTLSKGMYILLNQRSTHDQEVGNDNLPIDQALGVLIRLLRVEETRLSTGASPVKPDGSAGLSESRVTQTDPEKQLGLHDGIPAKPENTKT